MSSLAVTWGIAQRSLRLIPRIPSTFFPSLIMPVFLTISFAGAFSGLVELPGFPAEKMLDWVIPMTTLQGCAFAGVTTGVAIARDLENGFYDRLLLSPASRAAIVAGPLLAAMLRAVFPLTLLIIVAVVARANFQAGPLAVIPLAVAGFGMALSAASWAVGLALRFKTQQVAPLMQMGVFMSVFLSTAQAPLELITGWVHAVARFNPVTNVLALARQGFLGDLSWQQTYPGLLSLAGMCAVLVFFAYRGIKNITP